VPGHSAADQHRRISQPTLHYTHNYTIIQREAASTHTLTLPTPPPPPPLPKPTPTSYTASTHT
jgi:hypothetical protein